ncbi:DUF4175 domain-containing protein, partial [bacterium]|nr:DUF4175 domain-containing protein [bacterium]
MTKEFPFLINKIDEFIRKYYKNQLLKGGLFALGTLAAFFIIINLLEYFGNFNITFRTILFYLYLSANIFILYFLVIIPIAKLYRFGKIISYEDAAIIIGKHFPEIKDKLLNTLQLQKLGENAHYNNEILNAGIDQKIKELKPVPFAGAVDLSQNRKYIKYILPPLMIILVLLFADPSVIT